MEGRLGSVAPLLKNHQPSWKKAAVRHLLHRICWEAAFTLLSSERGGFFAVAWVPRGARVGMVSADYQSADACKTCTSC